MKRITLITLVFGIAVLFAPAAQARVMSDDSGGGNAVALQTDTLGGNGLRASVPIRPDVLGGTGEPNPQVIHPDILGGDGGASARDIPVVSGNGDSFAWGQVAGIALLAAMLLALATTTVTRRRHRLSF
jgi:hypothetical protein